jgi:predicted ATP-grasp superfamily ATP-dependent carboligase
MKRLILLGASVRAAAHSAIRAGFTPYAIDLFADRDLAVVCRAVRIERYPRDYAAALAAAPAAPWIYTGGLENYPRLIDRLARIRPLWGNGGKGLRDVRDPRMLAEVVREAGLRFPETVSSPRDRRRLEELSCRGAADQNWLVKRRRSSGGLGVRFWTGGPVPRGAYLQRYIEGQPASALFVAANRRATLLGTSQQLIGRDFGIHDRPFLYAGSIGPLALSNEQMAQLTSLGHLLAQRFGLVGLIGVDFVLAGGEVFVLEVNPRYTASVEVLERAHQFDSVSLHVAACEHGELPPVRPSPTSPFVGKAIVYAGRDGVVPDEFDQLVRDLNRPGRPALIADLPAIGQPIRAGQPVVTVFTDGKSADDVTAALQAAASNVTQVLESSTT